MKRVFKVKALVIKSNSNSKQLAIFLKKNIVGQTRVLCQWQGEWFFV